MLTGDGILDNLYLALIQCFAVIICGYLAGRAHMIMQRDTSGLNTFVGKFSLPSLIFISLCKLDLSSVNWMFILAIFVSKMIVFFLVLIIGILVTRPTNAARAGLLAIFCTQTNDFAIGVPIVDALYKNSHPEFVSYLYLLAPISLTILNPIGFVMMEIGKQPAISASGANVAENRGWQMIRSVIRNIITNPIVFMTALGMVGNFVFSHNPPVVLESVLNIFGSAFTGTALMLLGLRMVGRVHTLQGAGLLIPSILIITKLLLTPILMRQVTALFLQYHDNKTDTLDLTTFSFLYGTIPSAPGVFVYATAYALDVDLIAASMVACTFLSAPLMFISAEMIAASTMDQKKTDIFIMNSEYDISASSLIGGIVVIVVLTMKKKFGFPHRLTFFLVISQIIASAGSIIKYYKIWKLAAIMEISSDMCAALCAASLAIALLFIHVKAELTLHNVQPALIILPWGIPICLSTILISLFRVADSAKQTYVMVSTGLRISVLIFSLIVTVVCLVLAERNRRQNIRYSSIPEDDFPASISGNVMPRRILDKSSPKYDSLCDGQSTDDSGTGVHGRREMADHSPEDDMQLVRHFVLLVFMVCSFIVSLALLLWELVDHHAGLYVEVRFIETILRRGQAVFAFCVFALDYRNVIKPSIKWFIKLWYGGEPITLPKWDALPFETRLVCDQFVLQHLQKCKVDIEKTKWSSLFYGTCFTGSSLVNWLVHNGVVKDNEEAGVYAGKLLSGRIIRHIYNKEYFYNSSSIFYTFIAG